jgi:uncharacterized protein (DUF305 family)
MKWGVVAGVVAVVIVAGAAAYLVRGLAPSADAVAEGKAFTLANNQMMRDMADSAPLSGDADADFARLLMPHLRSTVDMAAIELKYGADQTVLGLAKRMTAARQPQIDQLMAWRKAHPTTAPAGSGVDAAAATAAYAAASDRLMNGMMGDSMAHSGNADRDFVKMMIPHHQGAMDMANVLLKYGRDPELKALAQKVVSTGQAEMGEMNGWVKTNGG